MNQPSPKPFNPHFDTKKPEAYICCQSCKMPLWEFTAKTSAGVLVSTECKPVGSHKQKIKDSETDCPLCGKQYFNAVGKEKQFLIRSTRTGQEFLL